MGSCNSIYQISLRTFTKKGTLKAAQELIPHIARMGFDSIYVCSLCEADADPDIMTWSPRQILSNSENPKNSYKIKDFFHVDPEYGTDEDLRDFIECVHKHGMKYIFDLVYLHCGRNAVFINEIQDSVIKGEDGKPIIGETWPFARINYESAEMREYLWKNMLYYAFDFDVDGFRCDVGNKVPVDFWAEGARRIREKKPNFIMLSEGFDPAYYSDEYKDVFDLWYLGDCPQQALLKGEMTTKEFKEEEIFKDCQTDSKGARYLENHDTASDMGSKRADKRTRLYGPDNFETLMNYLWNGVPFVWNGFEVADNSVQSMFASREYGGFNSIDWSYALTDLGIERMNFIKSLNAIRNKHPELQFSKMSWLSDKEGMLAFKHSLNGEELFAVLNYTDKEISEDFDRIPEKAELCGSAAVSKNTLTLGAYGYYVGYIQE